MAKTRRKAEEIDQRYAGRVGGEDFAVTTVRTDAQDKACQKRPCAQCPWVKGRVGVFPPDAYRHSARTAYDMAQTTFACHMTGTENPTTCAGFLLRGATHNLSVRLSRRLSEGVLQAEDGGEDLYANYREMAVANGVPADDPILGPCRDDV